MWRWEAGGGGLYACGSQTAPWARTKSQDGPVFSSRKPPQRASRLLSSRFRFTASVPVSWSGAGLGAIPLCDWSLRMGFSRRLTAWKSPRIRLGRRWEVGRKSVTHGTSPASPGDPLSQPQPPSLPRVGWLPGLLMACKYVHFSSFPFLL